MIDIEYDGLAERIQSVYSSCSKIEQQHLKQILIEMSIHGYSQTLEQLWLADFKEVPVSIDQFICDSQYLGETNRNGEGVYPFWRQTARDIFGHGNKYNEIVLSGATRIGKTSTMTLIMAYMLYRLMLYKDPHTYFKKKAVSRFTIGFANLNQALAHGVCYREFNDTLKNSEWFCKHGSFSRSDKNFYYIPEGDKIDIVAGSDSSNFLGMQLWACLTGNTTIRTNKGNVSLSELSSAEGQIVVEQFDYHTGKYVFVESSVCETKKVFNTILLKLDDDFCVECTPDHRFLMNNRSYKTADNIVAGDMMYGLEVVQQKIVIHHDRPIPVYDVINAFPYHNFVVVDSKGNRRVIAHNCAVDECNFAKSGVKDISLAKAHMKGLYDTINARISGTFRLNGEVYGKMITASSKNTDSDFLSDHITTQLNAGNSSLYLVDKPQWEILPKEMFSTEVFHFTVGDRYKKGFVIPPENDDQAHIDQYIKDGFQVIEAPAELRKNFVADYDIALRDIAGISVAGAMGFITQDMITPCISTTRHNPFYSDIIVIGKEDSSAIEDYFHIEAVPANLKRCIMHIHLDLSETGDKTGITGVGQDGSKIIEQQDGKKVSMPFYREIFSVALKNPPGTRLSFQKVVNFLIWLRRQNFNIGIISTDQYQSSYLREVLEQQNFATEKISVDRSEDPYIGLRNMLYDQRIELLKNDLRDTELIHLERYNGRIDHPQAHPDFPDGKGSKDVADSLCGACYTLVKHGVVSPPPTKHIVNSMSRVNANTRSGSSNLGMFNQPRVFR